MTWLGRHWRLAHPGAILGNQRGGLLLAPPLPPLGTLLTGNQYPLSLSPQALLAFVAPSVNPGMRPAQTGELVGWEEVRSVKARGKQVRVNGRRLLAASSTLCAARLAGQLEELSRLPAAKRAAAIEQLIREGLDTKAVEGRWAEFQQQASGLRLPANLLVGYVFGAAPLLIWQFGFRRCWLGLLLGLLGFTITIATGFRRAHRALYPEAEDERFTQFLLVLLAPATTMRALDLLSRPLLERFHPLAIARVFCPEPEFGDFARAAWREVCHPALPVCPAGEPRAAEVEMYFRGALKSGIEKLLRQSALAPETLAAPPAPADETCRWYCPHCLAQFTAGPGACADCGGLALLPLNGS